MNYFNISDISVSLLESSTINYLLNKGSTWGTCNWTIIPTILNDADKALLKPIVDKLLIKPLNIALLTTPANSCTAVHRDHLPDPPSFDNKTVSTGRITAINVPLKVYNNSWVEFFKEDTKTFDQPIFYTDTSAICLKVELPHRVNNSLNTEHRVVLTFSYLETFETIFNLYQK